MTERWRLVKNGRPGPGQAGAVRLVRCAESTHPLGLELRVILGDSDLRRSAVFRDRHAADVAAAEWRSAWEAKGWRPPPSRFDRQALERALALTRDAQDRVPGDNAMGHVLSYRLKVMREALEVALADDVSLDRQLRELRLVDAMQELGRAERGPEGQAFVQPILAALSRAQAK